MDIVNFFKVLPITIHSDHYKIVLSLKCKISNLPGLKSHTRYETSPITRTAKWTDEVTRTYTHFIWSKEILENITQFMSNYYPIDCEGVNKANKDLTKIILTTMNPKANNPKLYHTSNNCGEKKRRINLDMIVNFWNIRKILID